MPVRARTREVFPWSMWPAVPTMTCFIALIPDRHSTSLRAWLYQGRDDTSPPSDLTSFASELHAAGAEVHYGFFPGGHDWGLWRRELPRMLVVAGRWFARPPTGSAAFTHVGRPRSDAAVRRMLRRHHLHCLHRKVRPGRHIGLGCRLYRRAHGIGPPLPAGAT